MSTIANTADQASDYAKEAASHARAALMDLPAQALKLVNGARDAEARGIEALLSRMGLQRRQSPLVPGIWFVVGAAVAGTAVLLLTPSTGKVLRQRIAKLFDREVASAEEHIQEVSNRMPNGIRHEAT
jgi:hypothetical protein